MQWVVYYFSIMYNYCKSCEYWVRWIDTLKFSSDVYYSERFKELELAIHTLSNNNQSLGIGYIVNEGNHNKKFVLSIIEFLKEIGWLVQDENGKNMHRTQQTQRKMLYLEWHLDAKTV